MTTSSSLLGIPEEHTEPLKRSYYDPIRDLDLRPVVDDVNQPIYRRFQASFASGDPVDDTDDVGMTNQARIGSVARNDHGIQYWQAPDRLVNEPRVGNNISLMDLTLPLIGQQRQHHSRQIPNNPALFSSEPAKLKRSSTTIDLTYSAPNKRQKTTHAIDPTMKSRAKPARVERLSPEVAIYAKGPRDWPNAFPGMPSWRQQPHSPAQNQECPVRNPHSKVETLPYLYTLPNSRDIRGYSSIHSPIEVSKLIKPHENEVVIDRLLECKDQSEDFIYSVRRQERLVLRAEREYFTPRGFAARVTNHESKMAECCALVREQNTLRSLAREKVVRETELADIVRREMDKIVPILDSWEAENELEMAAAELYLDGLREKQEDLRETRKVLEDFKDPRSKSSPVEVLGMLEGVKPLRK